MLREGPLGCKKGPWSWLALILLVYRRMKFYREYQRNCPQNKACEVVPKDRLILLVSVLLLLNADCCNSEASMNE